MARKIVAPAQPDPDTLSNRRVLADRQKRIDAAGPASAPAPPAESKAETALEFLTDEFDRRNFGEAIPTITRVVYGPDPLLDDPAFKERIEQYGVEAMAEFAAKAIIDKGALAFPNPMMRSVIARSIRKFGLEQVATAFHARVLEIPVRTVEIEVERDDEVLGNPLREAVQQYGTPGMAPKFLSEACISQLSMRGYRMVRKSNGDIVKVGTLFMAEIPQHIADKRRKAAADESIENVRDAEQSYQEAVERTVLDAGAAGKGSGPLYSGDAFTANVSEREDDLGRTAKAGISFDISTE